MIWQHVEAFGPVNPNGFPDPPRTKVVPMHPQAPYDNQWAEASSISGVRLQGPSSSLLPPQRTAGFDWRAHLAAVQAARLGREQQLAGLALIELPLNRQHHHDVDVAHKSPGNTVPGSLEAAQQPAGAQPWQPNATHTASYGPPPPSYPGISPGLPSGQAQEARSSPGSAGHTATATAVATAARSGSPAPSLAASPPPSQTIRPDAATPAAATVETTKAASDTPARSVRSRGDVPNGNKDSSSSAESDSDSDRSCRSGSWSRIRPAPTGQGTPGSVSSALAETCSKGGQPGTSPDHLQRRLRRRRSYTVVYVLDGGASPAARSSVTAAAAAAVEAAAAAVAAVDEGRAGLQQGLISPTREVAAVAPYPAEECRSTQGSSLEAARVSGTSASAAVLQQQEQQQQHAGAGANGRSDGNRVIMAKTTGGTRGAAASCKAGDARRSHAGLAGGGDATASSQSARVSSPQELLAAAGGTVAQLALQHSAQPVAVQAQPLEAGAAGAAADAASFAPGRTPRDVPTYASSYAAPSALVPGEDRAVPPDAYQPQASHAVKAAKGRALQASGSAASSPHAVPMQPGATGLLAAAARAAWSAPAPASEMPVVQQTAARPEPAAPPSPSSPLLPAAPPQELRWRRQQGNKGQAGAAGVEPCMQQAEGEQRLAASPSPPPQPRSQQRLLQQSEVWRRSQSPPAAVRRWLEGHAQEEEPQLRQRNTPQHSRACAANSMQSPQRKPLNKVASGSVSGPPQTAQTRAAGGNPMRSPSRLASGGLPHSAGTPQERNTSPQAHKANERATGAGGGSSKPPGQPQPQPTLGRSPGRARDPSNTPAVFHSSPQAAGVRPLPKNGHDSHHGARQAAAAKHRGGGDHEDVDRRGGRGTAASPPAAGQTPTSKKGVSDRPGAIRRTRLSFSSSSSPPPSPSSCASSSETDPLYWLLKANLTDRILGVRGGGHLLAASATASPFAPPAAALEGGDEAAALGVVNGGGEDVALGARSPGEARRPLTPRGAYKVTAPGPAWVAPRRLWRAESPQPLPPGVGARVQEEFVRRVARGDYGEGRRVASRRVERGCMDTGGRSRTASRHPRSPAAASPHRHRRSRSRRDRSPGGSPRGERRYRGRGCSPAHRHVAEHKEHKLCHSHHDRRHFYDQRQTRIGQRGAADKDRQRQHDWEDGGSDDGGSAEPSRRGCSKGGNRNRTPLPAPDGDAAAVGVAGRVHAYDLVSAVSITVDNPLLPGWNAAGAAASMQPFTAAAAVDDITAAGVGGGGAANTEQQRLCSAVGAVTGSGALNQSLETDGAAAAVLCGALGVTAGVAKHEKGADAAGGATADATATRLQHAGSLAALRGSVGAARAGDASGSMQPGSVQLGSELGEQKAVADKSADRALLLPCAKTLSANAQLPPSFASSQDEFQRVDRQQGPSDVPNVAKETHGSPSAVNASSGLPSSLAIEDNRLMRRPAEEEPRPTALNSVAAPQVPQPLHPTLPVAAAASAAVVPPLAHPAAGDAAAAVSGPAVGRLTLTQGAPTVVSAERVGMPAIQVIITGPTTFVSAGPPVSPREGAPTSSTQQQGPHELSSTGQPVLLFSQAADAAAWKRQDSHKFTFATGPFFAVHTAAPAAAAGGGGSAGGAGQGVGPPGSWFGSKSGGDGNGSYGQAAAPPLLPEQQPQLPPTHAAAASAAAREGFLPSGFHGHGPQGSNSRQQGFLPFATSWPPASHEQQQRQPAVPSHPQRPPPNSDPTLSQQQQQQHQYQQHLAHDQHPSSRARPGAGSHLQAAEMQPAWTRGSSAATHLVDMASPHADSTLGGRWELRGSSSNGSRHSSGDGGGSFNGRPQQPATGPRVTAPLTSGRAAGAGTGDSGLVAGGPGVVGVLPLGGGAGVEFTVRLTGLAPPAADPCRDAAAQAGLEGRREQQPQQVQQQQKGQGMGSGSACLHSAMQAYGSHPEGRRQDDATLVWLPGHGHGQDQQPASHLHRFNAKTSSELPNTAYRSMAPPPSPPPPPQPLTIGVFAAAPPRQHAAQTSQPPQPPHGYGANRLGPSGVLHPRVSVHNSDARGLQAGGSGAIAAQGPPASGAVRVDLSDGRVLQALRQGSGRLQC
ncbi:hypothetical protein Agub_g8581 [Astrephomene gubernaculifera]|uniref:Uncharacterized protein n=1 Tax=Astrephomene gubernaculifera TaxID=47775 RepID=A0AAD3DS90_9CHLO|nr:hypothetical protein Agub_g8581 [Astrephomene gubernaculifera]